jgi:hypothetical protein
MVRIGPPRTPVLVQQHGVQVCTLGQRFMIANPTWIRMRWQRERFMEGGVGKLRGQAEPGVRAAWPVCAYLLSST